jgi:hypothetical protein
MGTSPGTSIGRTQDTTSRRRAGGGRRDRQHATRCAVDAPVRGPAASRGARPAQRPGPSRPAAPSSTATSGHLRSVPAGPDAPIRRPCSTAPASPGSTRCPARAGHPAAQAVQVTPTCTATSGKAAAADPQTGASWRMPARSSFAAASSSCSRRSQGSRIQSGQSSSSGSTCSSGTSSTLARCAVTGSR